MMLRASGQALLDGGPSNARYATLRTQLTQRVQDERKPSYVPDAPTPVDNSKLVVAS